MMEKAGNQNPFRYRGYCWDEETGLYYVGSRYYDPETCRFISPDTVEVLTASPTELTNKNLYAYCDNNPISREDKEGDMWELALAGGGAIAMETGFSLSAAGSVIMAGLGAITPVGWAVIATVVVVTAVCIGYEVLQPEIQILYRKRSKQNTGRPSLKKQGREGLEKKKGKNWQQNSGKKPRTQPRPHHPGKTHRKYIQ